MKTIGVHKDKGQGILVSDLSIPLNVLLGYLETIIQLSDLLVGWLNCWLVGFKDRVAMYS